MNTQIKRGGLILIFGILLFSLIGFASAATSSNVQSSLGSLFTSSSGSFDTSQCVDGQDFVVQISPLGCTPTVVRSDLLEEQDVQVYCPLSATQINPLVTLNSINSISFQGNYPSEVRSIGFYPAQAALGTGAQNLGYPVLSNIGYVVIDLKQIANESSLKNCQKVAGGLSEVCSVSGNLTANLKYSSTNAYGIGTVSYYLPELDDTTWNSGYSDYGFWGDKGYLRLDSVSGNQATISIYNSNLRKVATTTLTQGQTSGDLSIPGFDICSATMKVTLNGVENADTRAKLDINGNVVEVAQGENFLNNQCQVKSISKEGLVQSVKIGCSTDSGTKTFTLSISPTVTIEINGEKRNVALGDYLFKVPDVTASQGTTIQAASQGKYVYLGYIDYKPGLFSVPDASQGMDMNDVYLYLAITPRAPTEGSPNMTSGELSAFASIAKSLTPSQKLTNNPVLNSIGNLATWGLGGLQTFIQFIASGNGIAFAQYNKENSQLGVKVKFDGFSGSYNQILGTDVNTPYTQATTDYKTIQSDYTGEKYPSTATTTLDEKALYQQIVLASLVGQRETVSSLCSDFKSKFPDSSLNLGNDCTNLAALSSQTNDGQYIVINGQSYLISLTGVSEPSYDEFGTLVGVKYPNGNFEEFKLTKDQVVILNSTTGDFIQLSDVGDGTATVNVKAGVFSSGSLNLKLNTPQVLGQATGVLKSDNLYTLTLEKVNRKEYAKVTLTPKNNDKGSASNFSFTINVEKRAIQLSPEKTLQIIKHTNETIAQLQKISNITGSVVSGLSTACSVTGLVLNVKSFFNTLDGSGTARTQVMTGAGGWNEKCSTMVTQGKYSSLDQCFLDNSDQIDSDVEQMTKLMNNQSDTIKKIQADYTTKNGLLSQDVVDTSAFMQTYSGNVQSSLDCLSEPISNPSNSNAVSISVSDAKTLLSYDSYKENNYNVNQARNVQLYSQIICSSSSSDSLKNMAKEQLYTTLSNIQTNSNAYTEAVKTATAQNVDPSSVSFVQLGKDVKKYAYNGLTVGDLKTSISGKDNKENTITASTPVAVVQTSTGDQYILVLDNSAGTSRYFITGVYDMNGNDVSKNAPDQFKKMYFEKVDASTYQNKYKSNSGSTVPEVQYFETDPYKGMPAIVPFDLNNGWYAAVKQVSSSIGTSTSSSSYDASGRVESFYLCNVGANGIEEFNSGIGDDICQSMDLSSGTTYTTFSGLSSSEVTKLVGKAVTAIQDAAKQYKSGVSTVVINGNNIKVGEPATSTPAVQCQDFMSPKDCNTLFNVCDPVVCPSSRCNFGGAYPVSNVIQTGVVGGVLLCLPNAKEGIKVPLCLTGIKAGLDNWISVEQSYAKCMQENLDTGKMTGICDEVRSIYTCNLFWQEVAPLAGIAIPKIAESLSGENTRGGGEYQNIQSALDNAKKSASYITSTYASSTTTSFSLGTNISGGNFCGNFISTVFPDQAGIINKLSTTDSPPQYMGSFEEIPYTTATVPATSQYKVYYHIYAGQSSGAYYRVYLESSGSSYYQDSASTQLVASGYLSAGESADDTKDFTAPSGYTKLCINVNGNEDCGFKEVSTDLALNAIKDAYVASQVNNTDITTESECTSGTISLASVLGSVQSGSGLNPSISSLGITRVCATQDPGNGTDTYAGTAKARWVKVGYCDNTKVGCWIDTQSVKDAINSPDIATYLATGNTTTLQNTTLQSLTSAYLSVLMNESNYVASSDFDSIVNAILADKNPSHQINNVSAILNKVFYNNQKAELLLIRGNAYKTLALDAYASNSSYSPATETGSGTSSSGTSGSSGASSSAETTQTYADCMKQFNSYLECYQYALNSPSESVYSDNSITPTDNFISVIFQYGDDSIATPYTYFEYSQGTWFFSSDAKAWYGVGDYSLLQNNPNSLDVAKKLNSQSYSAGLKILIDKVNSSAGTVLARPELSAENVYMDHNKQFALNTNYYYKYEKDVWQVNPQISTNPTNNWYPITSDTSSGLMSNYGVPKALAEGLVDKDVYAGAALIFASNGETDTAVVPVQGSSASSQSATTSTTPTTTSTDQATQDTADMSTNYNKYKTYFDEYAAENVPSGWTQNEFEALLLAVAQYNNWGGTDGNILMGYHPLETTTQSPDNQVKIVASILKNALNGNSDALGWQSTGNVIYTCSAKSIIDNARLKCVLSFYHTGKINSPGFFGIGKNSEGIDYANSVVDMWTKWKSFLSNNQVDAVSSAAPTVSGNSGSSGSSSAMTSETQCSSTYPPTTSMSSYQICTQAIGSQNCALCSNTNIDQCSQNGYNNYQDCLTQQTSIQGATTATTYCQQICPATYYTS